MFRCILPWPPTVNHYWISRVLNYREASKTGSRVMVCVGAKGKQFRLDVKKNAEAATCYEMPLFPTAKLKVEIFAYPPDRRKRDLDNILKALLDSLQHAGIYADDNQIDQIHIYRKDVIPNGQVIVEVEEIQQ